MVLSGFYYGQGVFLGSKSSLLNFSLNLSYQIWFIRNFKRKAFKMKNEKQLKSSKSDFIIFKENSYYAQNGGNGSSVRTGDPSLLLVLWTRVTCVVQYYHTFLFSDK